MVSVLIRSGRVLLTARVDLPPPEVTQGLGIELDRLAEAHDVAEAVVVVYSDDSARGREALTGLVAGLKRVTLTDAIFVDGHRWWSIVCDKPCCPVEGRPYEVQTHRLAAEAVYAGLTARSGRTDLEGLVGGPDPGAVPGLERLAGTLRPELASLTVEQAARRVETTVDAAVVGGAELDESSRLALTLLVADTALRDLVWAGITRENARAQIDLWTEVVAVAPPALSSAPLCLLGLAAWVDGDGALQNCCVERVHREDPDYSLGTLLAEIAARALPPSVWDDLRGELRAELGLGAG